MTAMHAPQKFWNVRRRRIYLTAFVGIVLFSLWSGLRVWSEEHGFLINTTDSLPNWAFVLDTKKAPHLGALVFFRAPPSDLLRVHFGEGEHLFGKKVFGVGGDVVSRKGRAFFVNGKSVGRAKEVSKRGVPLAAGPVGTIPQGCFFVGTENPDSFDSRYEAIGWICADRIVGVGKAVL